MAQGLFSDENSIRRVPNYFVRQQVTRFIKQGYTMVTTLSRKALAALSPTADTIVVALLNNSTRPAVHQITLPGISLNGKAEAYQTSDSNLMQPIAAPTLSPNSEAVIPLPPSSITTLVFPIERISPSHQTPITNGTYLIIPQSNCEMALTANNGHVYIEPANASDKRQLWNIIQKDGKYNITNTDGQTITDWGEYTLSATAGKENGQCFSIEPVEDYFHKITNAEGKAFDLQGNCLLEGTVVGLYPYGSSVSADTRNWHLLRVSDN